MCHELVYIKKLILFYSQPPKGICRSAICVKTINTVAHGKVPLGKPTVSDRRGITRLCRLACQELGADQNNIN